MLWTLLRTLDRQRLQPVVAFLQPGPFEHDVAALGIETHVIPAGRLRHARGTGRTVRTLAAMLRAERPDAIVSWSAKAHLYAGSAAFLTGISSRAVWWQHGIPSGHWIDAIATAIPAAAVGCSSNAAREAQRFTRPRRACFVVNPGIEAQPNERPRRGTGRSERLTLGIVGRLQPWKGQHLFLRALALLRGRGHDVNGLVVGGDAYELSPEYAAGLEDLVVELGLGDHVTMTGQVADPSPYLEQMDVAVNASAPEPFGIVLLEAMAAGVAVVAIAEGGPLDIIEHGESGVLAPDAKPDSIADSVEPLLVDARLREALAGGGRERLLEHFTAEHMTAAFTESLASVIR
jgi:glycosyltransferase involved in cell wall biosynthesis